MSPPTPGMSPVLICPSGLRGGLKRRGIPIEGDSNLLNGAPWRRLQPFTGGYSTGRANRKSSMSATGDHFARWCRLCGRHDSPAKKSDAASFRVRWSPTLHRDVPGKKKPSVVLTVMPQGRPGRVVFYVWNQFGLRGIHGAKLESYGLRCLLIHLPFSQFELIHKQPTAFLSLFHSLNLILFSCHRNKKYKFQP